MRTLECLVHQYPEKNGAELIAIQQQDKIADQKEFEKLHQAKIDFVKDVKKNGGYYRGKFGLDQHFMYHITDIHLEDNGIVYVDTEKIIVFLGCERGVVKEDDFNFEKRTDTYKDASKYGFEIYDRVTVKEWDELIQYCKAINQFWQVNHSMIKYYCFGEEAAKTYFENNSIEAILNQGVEFKLYKHNPHCLHAVDNLLSAFSGYGGYFELCEAEYDELINYEDNNLLKELNQLREIELNGKLNKEQKRQYIEIVEKCKENDIEIPFGIEI